MIPTTKENAINVQDLVVDKKFAPVMKMNATVLEQSQ
jgi:hypothetical protein